MAATYSARVRTHAFSLKRATEEGSRRTQDATCSHLELVLTAFQVGRSMVKIVLYKYDSCCRVEHGLEEYIST